MDDPYSGMEIVDGGVAIFGKALAAVLGPLLYERLRKVRRSMLPTVRELQADVFGIGRERWIALQGQNTWTSEDGGVFGGKQDPLPPYNVLGLERLAVKCGRTIDTFSHATEALEERYRASQSVLILGGDRIFRRIDPSLTEHLIHIKESAALPYNFLPLGRVDARRLRAEDAEPEPPPAEITRRYLHRVGDRLTRYSKRSWTGSDHEHGAYLTNLATGEPLGPFVRDARIATDVVSLIVWPGPGGRKLSLVRAGYGAASLLPELLTRREFLRRYDGVLKQGAAAFQAVFSVAVKHSDIDEVYDPKRLVCRDVQPVRTLT